MTQSPDASGPSSPLATELWAWMHTASSALKLANFPAILRSAAVQSKASELGLALSDPEELRQILSSILTDLEQSEGADGKVGTQNYSKARPTSLLLGLTEQTKRKSLLQRQDRYARRWMGKASLSTAKRHTMPLAEWLAGCLEQKLLPSDNSYSHITFDREAAAIQKVADLRTRDWMPGESVALPASELPALVRAHAKTYGEFADDLLRISEHSLAGYYEDETATKRLDTREYRPIYSLTKRGFTNDMDLARAFCVWVTTVEPGRYSGTGVRYMSHALHVLIACLPTVSPLQQESLNYAMQESKNNFQYFLVLLRETEPGRDFLDHWQSWLFGDLSRGRAIYPGLGTKPTQALMCLRILRKYLFVEGKKRISVSGVSMESNRLLAKDHHLGLDSSRIAFV